jgi:hypothetical protein
MIARLVTQPPSDAASAHACSHRDAQARAHAEAGTTGAHDLADRMGIGVSLTCAVHCAAAGALSVAPSFVGLGAHGGGLGGVLEMMVALLLACALVIGLYSLVPSYRNEHRNAQPIALFLFGLGQLVLSRFVEGPLEIGLTVVGVAFIASAHLVNLRACARAHRASREAGVAACAACG